MHSDAAPQSVHSSCCTNGTARLLLRKPSLRRAGKLAAISLFVAVVMALLEVLLEGGKQRDDEALAFDAHLRLRRHAGVVSVRNATRPERACWQLRFDEHVGPV